MPRPPARPRAVPVRTGVPALALAAALSLTATACEAGPGGVDLGTDWKGSTTFVLAEVGGELTVVGVNPVKATAQSLAVVPSQSDDSDVIDPQIARLADRSWVIAVPREGGRPDRLYGIDRTEHAVSGTASGWEAMHGLYPARNHVAGVPALPDEGKGGEKLRGEASGVLVQSPQWKTERTVPLTGGIALAASQTGSDVLCLGQNDGPTDLTTVDLTTGRTLSHVTVPAGTEVRQLACDDGHPVVAGPAKAKTGPAVSERKDGFTAVAVPGARIDQLSASGGVVTAAVFVNGHEYLLSVDTRTGRETRRTPLPGLNDAAGLQPTPQGWLVLGPEDKGVLVAESGTTRPLTLPGRLLAS